MGYFVGVCLFEEIRKKVKDNDIILIWLLLEIILEISVIERIAFLIYILYFLVLFEYLNFCHFRYHLFFL